MTRRTVDTIASVYGPFDLDAATFDKDTAVVPTFYGAEDDGYALPWFGRVWCAPALNFETWCVKAMMAVEFGECELVAMVVPATVNAAWFQQFVIPCAAWRPLGDGALHDIGTVLAVYPGEGLLPALPTPPPPVTMPPPPPKPAPVVRATPKPKSSHAQSSLLES